MQAIKNLIAEFATMLGVSIAAALGFVAAFLILTICVIVGIVKAPFATVIGILCVLIIVGIAGVVWFIKRGG